MRQGHTQVCARAVTAVAIGRLQTHISLGLMAGHRICDLVGSEDERLPRGGPAEHDHALTPAAEPLGGLVGLPYGRRRWQDRLHAVATLERRRPGSLDVPPQHSLPRTRWDVLARPKATRPEIRNIDVTKRDARFDALVETNPLDPAERRDPDAIGRSEVVEDRRPPDRVHGMADPGGHTRGLRVVELGNELVHLGQHVADGRVRPEPVEERCDRDPHVPGHASAECPEETAILGQRPRRTIDVELKADDRLPASVGDRTKVTEGFGERTGERRAGRLCVVETPRGDVGPRGRQGVRPRDAGQARTRDPADANIDEVRHDARRCGRASPGRRPIPVPHLPARNRRARVTAGEAQTEAQEDDQDGYGGRCAHVDADPVTG